jgi:hypothetical protein
MRIRICQRDAEIGHQRMGLADIPRLNLLEKVNGRRQESAPHCLHAEHLLRARCLHYPPGIICGNCERLFT